MSQISNEQIEKFLSGTDPQTHIVAIEANYSDTFVELIVNNPETGKVIEKHPYQPFLWIKEEITQLIYGGKRLKIIEASKKYGIKFIRLRTTNDEGFEPSRLANGYKLLVKCSKTYNDLVLFFESLNNFTKTTEVYDDQF